METKLKPASELTDQQAEQQLDEMLGRCRHSFSEIGEDHWICKGCGVSEVELDDTDPDEKYHKPYATSWDAIIPVMLNMDDSDKWDINTNYLNGKGLGYEIRFTEPFEHTPRQLLNIVIEALRKGVKNAD